jgi:O-antigen/teichoic acid export membrane protein
MVYINQITRWLNSNKTTSLKSQITKSGIAVIDQGLFSGSNFILNIFLARWLSSNEYGTFSLVFAVFLFFSGFHNALVLEPLSVFGTSKYPKILKEYLAGQFIIHLFVTGFSGVLIILAGVALYFLKIIDSNLLLFIVGPGLFLPFMLLIWLARRSCYVFGRPILAFWVSVVYSVALMSGAFFVHRSGGLFHVSLDWYFLFGFASLAGSLLVFMNPAMVNFQVTGWLSWMREQWAFGKWIVLATFLNFAGTQVQIFVVAAQLDLGQAGVFRALQNFILPMVQVLTAITTLVLPMIAFDFGNGNLQAVKLKAFKTSAGLTLGSFLYLVVLYLFSGQLENLLYGGKYSEFSPLIFALGLIPLIAAMEAGYSLVVRSLQRPLYYVITTGIMALIGTVFTPLFVFGWGVYGAVFVLILVALASLMVNIWFYRRWFEKRLMTNH